MFLALQNCIRSQEDKIASGSAREHDQGTGTHARNTKQEEGLYRRQTKQDWKKNLQELLAKLAEFIRHKADNEGTIY